MSDTPSFTFVDPDWIFEHLPELKPGDKVALKQHDRAVLDILRRLQHATLNPEGRSGTFWEEVPRVREVIQRIRDRGTLSDQNALKVVLAGVAPEGAPKTVNEIGIWLSSVRWRPPLTTFLGALRKLHNPRAGLRRAIETIRPVAHRPGLRTARTADEAARDELCELLLSAPKAQEFLLRNVTSPTKCLRQLLALKYHTTSEVVRKSIPPRRRRIPNRRSQVAT
jgi:hypothetical protein